MLIDERQNYVLELRTFPRRLEKTTMGFLVAENAGASAQKECILLRVAGTAMKILFVGTDPQTTRSVQDVARQRLPGVTFLVVRQPDDGLQVTRHERPDIVVYQLTSDRKSLKSASELQKSLAISMILVAPVVHGGAPAFAAWASGFPHNLLTQTEQIQAEPAMGQEYN